MFLSFSAIDVREWDVVGVKEAERATDPLLVLLKNQNTPCLIVVNASITKF